MTWTNAHRHRTPSYNKLKTWAKNNLPHTCNHPHCTATSDLELDHITPYSQGGTDTTNNVQWLCPQHHWQKTKKEQHHWQQRTKRTPRKPIGLT